MNPVPLNGLVKKSNQRHIFSRFRFHIRYLAGPIYVSFAFFDYLYQPDHIAFWFGLRLFFWASTFFAFGLAVKFIFFRRNIEWLATAMISLSCLLIDVMIYQSGGYRSLYVTGLILCSTTGLQIFRLRQGPSLVALLLSYLPAVAIIMLTAPRSDLNLALIQSGFLLGMTVLSTIYGKSEEQVDKLFARFKAVANAEIERHRRTEILKRHFPKVIRESFEKNPNQSVGRKVLPNAVVGFADIVGSSQLANTVPLTIDWELKERFLEAATKRAIESEMVVLTHLGDGFLFLANYNESSQWYYNLISFYENLVRDYQQIMRDLDIKSSGVSTGVKFGVSSGPAMVGFLGKDQSYFTAIGPDVNLASRLCAEAEPNKILVSSRIWHSIRPLLIGWDTRTETYSKLKGFSYDISAVHISPRLTGKNDLTCVQCGSTMSLIRTEDGFLDYRCANGHNTPVIQPVILESAKNAA